MNTYYQYIQHQYINISFYQHQYKYIFSTFISSNYFLLFFLISIKFFFIFYFNQFILLIETSITYYSTTIFTFPLVHNNQFYFSFYVLYERLTLFLICSFFTFIYFNLLLLSIQICLNIIMFKYSYSKFHAKIINIKSPIQKNQSAKIDTEMNF